MASKVFRYLIPIYCVWFIGHMITFVHSMMNNSFMDSSRIAAFILLMASHFFVIIIGKAFWIYMVIDCATRKFKDKDSKTVWVLVVALTGLVGSIVYYYIHGQNPNKKTKK